MRADKVLTIGGTVLLVGGVIGAIAMTRFAQERAFRDQLIASFDNRMIEATPDYTGAVIFGVLALIGAIMLIAWLAARTIKTK